MVSVVHYHWTEQGHQSPLQLFSVYAQDVSYLTACYDACQHAVVFKIASSLMMPTITKEMDTKFRFDWSVSVEVILISVWFSWAFVLSSFSVSIWSFCPIDYLALACPSVVFLVYSWIICALVLWCMLIWDVSKVIDLWQAMVPWMCYLWFWKPIGFA